MKSRQLLPLMVLLQAAIPLLEARAGQPAEPIKGLRSLTVPGVGSLEALSGALRAQLMPHLPTTLYEASLNWGKSNRTPNGVKWRGLRPEVNYADKNDGVWRRVRITAGSWADTLVLDLRNMQHPEPGRMTFDVFLSFDARMDYDQQNWESGIRLWSGSVNARFRVKLLLHCEASVHLDSSRKILPDAVIRLGVTNARLDYDNLVVEHVAGIGGEAAKLLGNAAKGSLRQWRPSLEQELLARGNAAIVKAAGTREVRVNLLSILRGAS